MLGLAKPQYRQSGEYIELRKKANELLRGNVSWEDFSREMNLMWQYMSYQERDAIELWIPQLKEAYKNQQEIKQLKVKQ